MSDAAVLGFWLKNFVATLVLLPAGPMIGMLLGLALLGRRRWLGGGLIVFSATSLFAFSLPVVASAMAAYDERRFPPLDPTLVMPPHAAIVVLSGGAQLGATDYGGETINPTTLVRLRSAVHLAKRTRLPILVTGGRLPLSARSEAAQMAEAMDQDFHVPVKWIESDSLDTADNARLSAPILKAAGIQTAVLVSDVSHMRRARRAFEATGLAVILAPTDYYATSPVSLFSFLPNAGSLRRSNVTLHEWLGAVWMELRDALRGRTTG